MSRRTCWRFFPLLAIWLLLPLSNAYAGNLTLAVAANFTDTTASRPSGARVMVSPRRGFRDSTATGMLATRVRGP